MTTIDIKLKSYSELIFEISKLNTDKYLLEQENKHLEEEIEEYKRIEQEDLKAFNNYDSILAELEEWLKEIKKIYEEDVFDIVSNTIYNQCEDTLDKIQELKEKYK